MKIFKCILLLVLLSNNYAICQDIDFEKKEYTTKDLPYEFTSGFYNGTVNSENINKYLKNVKWQKVFEISTIKKKKYISNVLDSNCFVIFKDSLISFVSNETVITNNIKNNFDPPYIFQIEILNSNMDVKNIYRLYFLCEDFLIIDLHNWNIIDKIKNIQECVSLNQR